MSDVRDRSYRNWYWGIRRAAPLLKCEHTPSCTRQNNNELSQRVLSPQMPNTHKHRLSCWFVPPRPGPTHPALLPFTLLCPRRSSAFVRTHTGTVRIHPAVSISRSAVPQRVACAEDICPTHVRLEARTRRNIAHVTPYRCLSNPIRVTPSMRRRDAAAIGISHTSHLALSAPHAAAAHTTRLSTPEQPTNTCQTCPSGSRHGVLPTVHQ
jgi:hypothetical protein